MRRVVIVGLLLAGCAGSGGGDGALAATAVPTLEITATPFHPPEHPAPNAMLRLECPDLSTGSIFDYIEGAGHPTPEEAFANFDPQNILNEREPNYSQVTDEAVQWVYLNDEGQEIALIRAERIGLGLWVVSSINHCWPLEW